MKNLILVLTIVLLSGCKGYTYFEDVNGREHCRCDKTGTFVIDTYCFGNKKVLTTDTTQ